ncbi:MAG: hypothetical protein ACRDZN_11100 [Acidimicrobiales bacterium]
MDGTKDSATQTVENFHVLSELYDLANPQPKYKVLLDADGPSARHPVGLCSVENLELVWRGALAAGHGRRAAGRRRGRRRGGANRAGGATTDISPP